MNSLRIFFLAFLRFIKRRLLASKYQIPSYIVVIVFLFYFFDFGGDAPRPASRQDKVKSQFSSWDGSHMGLTRHIKDRMNDPDSYEHVETRFMDKGDKILVRAVFRGKNAFGGVVTDTATAYVDYNGNVIDRIK